METTPATDGITEGIEVRKQRGLEIAALARIETDGLSYFVPSQFAPAQTKYKVYCGGDKATCTCADHETRGCKCKHIYAVEFYMRRETTHHADGSTTVTENVIVKKTRKTYKQNWPAYNEAQVQEKREFQSLLADLCEMIAEPTPDKPGRGRPSFPISDIVYSIIYKVYSKFSGRRFISDLCDAQAKGFISRVPHYNTSFKYIENPELFPLLLAMVEKSSLPLKAIETKFAVDSTGFAYSRFVRWYDIKYNRFTAEKQWIKAHLCTGVKTNVITSVVIKDKDAGDGPQLPELVQKTAENFTMSEVSADKGYTGRESHDAIAAVGATPFIMFKSNATGAAGGLYQKMFHYFQFKREDFLAHYHQRSNVESTVMMVKTKFGDSVKSKTEVAAKNEVLCKILCHNICCLISAIYELGIEPVFSGELAHKLPPMPTKSENSCN